ncbi:ABC transporter permease [Microbacterium schleiferi]|uniref:FtsX-like permease family protein n=1 Tax=Microbacterium schleiferi TaxID=69362 RepID=A0ABU7VAK5_9MICO
MISRLTAVTREAIATAVSQPVASLMTVVVVIGMILTVMLTTGRTVGAEQRVLGSIDEAGTRAIQVRAENGAGLTSDVLDRISTIEGIEWAAAFSSAIDATNTAVPDGTRVPVRLAYGTHLSLLGIPANSPLPGELAYASTSALDQLGLPDGAGSITTTAGTDFALAGVISVPDFLESFEPVVLAPQPNATGDEAVNVLLVIAERPDLVTPVSNAVLSVLAVDDPSMISIETSESLAHLRAIVQSQLGAFSRGLVLATLAVTGLLVAAILYALVTMRRKDFGRRRALGASRGLIVALLMIQTILLAAVGSALGVATAVIALAASGDPLPGMAFITALAILTIVTAGIAALIPAVVASKREPIRELRVP